jgi:hypothetical protein
VSVEPGRSDCPFHRKKGGEKKARKNMNGGTTSHCWKGAVNSSGSASPPPLFTFFALRAKAGHVGLRLALPAAGAHRDPGNPKTTGRLHRLLVVTEVGKTRPC